MFQRKTSTPFKPSYQSWREHTGRLALKDLTFGVGAEIFLQLLALFLIKNLSKCSRSVGRASDSKFHVNSVLGSNPEGKFVIFSPLCIFIFLHN